ncbi:hypothetical protein HMPREF1980_00571 [Actinomyces sp. oral taxon 172 str. F0311]|nr:hypothetical protein HMPREF1980_00571 [Actinomyces sp. oral taxon 172 str. F0311]
MSTYLHCHMLSHASARAFRWARPSRINIGQLPLTSPAATLRACRDVQPLDISSSASGISPSSGVAARLKPGQRGP